MAAGPLFAQMMVRTLNAWLVRKGLALAYREHSLAYIDQEKAAKLHAGRFLCGEKASSGLPLQPTDLPSLPTEEIAHFSPLLETTQRVSARCWADDAGAPARP
jgi:hypothetical protein